MHITVLSEIWPPALKQLQDRFECVLALNANDSEKLCALSNAEVAIYRSPVRLDRAALDAASRLRLVIRAGSGLESIDLAAARERGVRVVSIPISANSVAEHTIGLMLALCRRIPSLDRSLRLGSWEKHSGLGLELGGRTLGLLGLGRIGQRTAHLAAAFDMQLIAHDRSPEKQEKQVVAQRLAIRFVDTDELFQSSDIVSIQTPLTRRTAGMVNRRTLAMMKPTALLINVGRGGIIDETALHQALERQIIAGAALDVFQQEPPGNSPLLYLDNFVGTPHVAAQTFEAQRAVGEDVVRIVHDFAVGQPLSAGVLWS